MDNIFFSFDELHVCSLFRAVDNVYETISINTKTQRTQVVLNGKRVPTIVRRRVLLPIWYRKSGNAGYDDRRKNFLNSKEKRHEEFTVRTWTTSTRPYEIGHDEDSRNPFKHANLGVVGHFSWGGGQTVNFV